MISRIYVNLPDHRRLAIEPTGGWQVEQFDNRPTAANPRGSWIMADDTMDDVEAEIVLGVARDLLADVYSNWSGHRDNGRDWPAAENTPIDGQFWPA